MVRAAGVPLRLTTSSRRGICLKAYTAQGLTFLRQMQDESVRLVSTCIAVIDRLLVRRLCLTYQGCMFRRHLQAELSWITKIT